MEGAPASEGRKQFHGVKVKKNFSYFPAYNFFLCLPGEFSFSACLQLLKKGSRLVFLPSAWPSSYDRTRGVAEIPSIECVAISAKNKWKPQTPFPSTFSPHRPLPSCDSFFFFAFLETVKRPVVLVAFRRRRDEFNTYPQTYKK